MRLPALPLRLVLPGSDDIIAAAQLKSRYRLAYADAFAVALAQREGAALLTGDPELQGIEEGLSIEWLGAEF